MPNAIPKTAADALKLWDEMHPVPAFRVETDDADQEQIYAAAFENIRAQLEIQGGIAHLGIIGADHLTVREKDVALSIANSAVVHGWAKMIEMHTGSGHIPLITVQKPPEGKAVTG